MGEKPEGLQVPSGVRALKLRIIAACAVTSSTSGTPEFPPQISVPIVSLSQTYPFCNSWARWWAKSPGKKSYLSVEARLGLGVAHSSVKIVHGSPPPGI